MDLRSKIVFFLSLAAILSGLVVASAGFGYRLGLFDLGFAFNLLRTGAQVAVGGAALGAIALLVALIPNPRGIAAFALIGLIAAGAAVGLPAMMRQQGASVPPIHDITTDMADPPRFVAVAEARDPGDNPTLYAGEDIAAQQREAYPDIQTIVLAMNEDAAFGLALDAVSEMGWELLSAEPNEGRIEATARTFWWGFEDDVVVRIRSDESGEALVDIRSASRVGRSDLGANAARIRKLMKKIEAGA